VLSDLDALLTKKNLGARQKFDHLKEHLAGPEFQAMLEKIETCLNKLDYNKARKQLGALALSLGVVLP
jgi:hypothetical protein